ncbi:MAG: hypothetical protein HYV08_09005 [Deltaproteobacteria bacterium]|nr:hypothetical protein [Deltaproteobacteria bacterium]MBI3075736.1 hypothetical protein [Deltaproteobacteria bacterium]
MPTREELADEERRLRQLRFCVDLTLQIIAQEALTVEEASKLVGAARRLAESLFPGKGHVFDLVYQPRFRRLMAERFDLH